MIRAGAAVCGPGDRLPCGTQQRIRLEPPLGQPPVLTNILINTILIMSLISLKPCTIISLMSSPTIRHTRTSPVEHSFPYYESHSHPKPHYQGQGAQNDLWGLFRSRYDAWCRPRWRYCCPAQPPLPSGLRRPLRGYSSWSLCWHQVTQHSTISVTSPPASPRHRRHHLWPHRKFFSLLSLFLEAWRHFLSFVLTISAIVPPMCRLTRILVRINVARCTSFAVCRIGTSPLGKENI